ncbi:MAG: 30S ribosomal protein S17 [Candidatus Hodgkinia cicadicola]
MGIVVKVILPSTLIVEVITPSKHKKYGKFLRKRKIYFVHDESTLKCVGDIVKFKLSRPFSSRKRWST